MAHRFKTSTGYRQEGNPNPVTSCGRRRPFMYKDSPLDLTDASYEKSNRKMRSKYTSETGRKLGKRLLKGKNKRRISFACRFGGMKGPMKDKKGRPTRKALALKKWGFGSVEAARNFCNKNKKK